MPIESVMPSNHLILLSSPSPPMTTLNLQIQTVPISTLAAPRLPSSQFLAPDTIARDLSPLPSPQILILPSLPSGHALKLLSRPFF